MGLILKDETHLFNHWPERFARRQKLEEELPYYYDYMGFTVRAFKELAERYPKDQLIQGMYTLTPHEMTEEVENHYREYISSQKEL